MKTKSKISDAKLAEVHQKLTVLKNRFKLIDFISQNPGTTIKNIWLKMRLSDESKASQDVADLKKTGWIDCEKVGKEVHCYVSQKALKEALSINKFNSVKDKKYFW